MIPLLRMSHASDGVTGTTLGVIVSWKPRRTEVRLSSAESIVGIHPSYRGDVTLSGEDGDDAKPYQEKQVRVAIDEVVP